MNEQFFHVVSGDVVRDRGNKQKVLKEGNSPVTGLAFQTTPKATYLFVVTLDSVWSYRLVSKDREIKVGLNFEVMLRLSSKFFRFPWNRLGPAG